MKSGFSFDVIVIVALLLSVVGVAAVSFFLLGDFNANVVNYATFTPTVNAEYAQFLQYSIISIALTMVFSLLSALMLFFHYRTRSGRLKVVGALFVFLFILSVFISLGLFNSFNDLVSVEIARFDANLAGSWARFFENYAFGFFIIQTIIVGLGAVSLALIPVSNRLPIKSTLPKAVSLLFLTVGASILGFSILYESVISLLAGLGLAFWGSSLIFVSAGSYVKKEVAEATSLYYIDSFSNLYDQAGDANELVYFPLSYAQSGGVNRVCVVKSSKVFGETFDKISYQNCIGANGQGLMKAPAADLLMLFEKTAGKRFDGADYGYFERVIPKLLVADLDIAQNAKVERVGEVVYVRIENPLDYVFYAEARQHPRLLTSIGTPLSSAIACALSNSTRRVVWTKNHQISKDGKTIEIEYQLLDNLEAA